VSNGKDIRVVGFVCALTYAMGAGPLITHMVSGLSPLLVDEFDLTSVQYGAIATTTFTLAALTSLVLRGIADRLDDRRSMFTIAAGAALGVVLVAGAETYLWLIAAAVAAGIAQGMSAPVTNRLIAHNMDSRQGPATGIKQSGIQVSQFLAGLAFPLLAPHLGWRGAATTGLVAVAAGMILIAVYVPRPVKVPRSVRRAGGAVVLSSMVWWLAGYSLVMGAGLQAISVYTPLFAKSELGFGAEAAGITTAVAGIVGVASRVLWSRATTLMQRPAMVLGVMALASAATSGVLVASSVWHVTALVWVACVLFGASAAAANAIVMIVLILTLPARSLGPATAMTVFGLYVGFAAGPVAFGALADATSLTVVMGASSGAFALALAAAVGWRFSRGYAQAVLAPASTGPGAIDTVAEAQGLGTGHELS
jgi:predicted MFS family arabinose efflux permease